MSLEQLDLFTSPQLGSDCETTTNKPLSIANAALAMERGHEDNAKQPQPDRGEVMSSDRLAHYRAKLAKWDSNGYTEIIAGQPMSVLEIIESDTLLGHNNLANDMITITNLKNLRWSEPAIGYYMRTRRKKHTQRRHQ